MRKNGKILNKLKAAAEFMTLFAIDMFSLVLIFFLAIFLRRDVLPLFYTGFPPAADISTLKVGLIFTVWIFFFFYEGFYSKRFSFWDEIKAHWRAAIFSTIGIFTIVSMGKLSEEISRTEVVLMGVSAIALKGGRAPEKKTPHRRRRRDRQAHGEGS
jgi:FlaA1/EpsC-like NDP-sugar epimerase